MTEKEILIVRSMREEGRSFGEISERTRLCRNTIKAWCKRNKVVPLDSIETCPQCGKRITGRKRRFCSDECCNKWWKEHSDLKLKKTDSIYTLTCKYCGKKFESYGNENRKYCSRECYFTDRFGSCTKYGD